MWIEIPNFTNHTFQKIILIYNNFFKSSYLIKKYFLKNKYNLLKISKFTSNLTK